MSLQGEIALSIENKLRVFSRLSKVPFVILRAFSIYGPFEESIGPAATVTGIFKRKYDLDAPITISGDGSNRRDFIHVDDIVTGIILAAQTSKSDNQLINLGSGTDFSIKQVADMVSPYSKYDMTLKGYDLKVSLADTDRMKSILGLKLNHSFSESYPKIISNQLYSLQMDAKKWVSTVDMNLAPWILNSGYLKREALERSESAEPVITRAKLL